MTIGEIIIFIALFVITGYLARQTDKLRNRLDAIERNRK